MDTEHLIWSSLPWIFLYLPLAGLAALCVLCLVRLPGERRRGLLPVAAAMAVCAAVLFGGAWLLGRFHLEWRMIPKVVLGLALWALGLASGILTARYAGCWLEERRAGLAVWGQALAIYCLISVMGAGSLLGGLWALFPPERVGTWQGQMVVQCACSLMDSTYEVYEYRGPLVRGADPLGWSESPMLEEAGQVKRQSYPSGSSLTTAMTCMNTADRDAEPLFSGWRWEVSPNY